MPDIDPVGLLRSEVQTTRRPETTEKESPYTPLFASLPPFLLFYSSENKVRMDDLSESGKKSQKPGFLVAQVRQTLGAKHAKDLQDLIQWQATHNHPNEHHHNHSKQKAFRVNYPKRVVLAVLGVFFGLPVFFFVWKETHLQTNNSMRPESKQHVRHRDVDPAWMEQAGALLMHHGDPGQEQPLDESPHDGNPDEDNIEDALSEDQSEVELHPDHEVDASANESLPDEDGEPQPDEEPETEQDETEDDPEQQENTEDDKDEAEATGDEDESDELGQNERR